jgi:predicted alpha/beta-hydrolase family hydrolase
MFVQFRVEAGDRLSVGARHYRAEAPRIPATLILAHGAGAPQTHPFMTGFAGGLATRGVDVITFNFPYAEAGRRVPDRASTLEACYLAAIASTRAIEAAGAQPLFIGGKSMGGRMASHVAAHHGAAAGPLAGLVFLGYPLHPPGRPQQKRDAHLREIGSPMLVVQGTRDAFGTAEELRAVADALDGRAEVLEVPAGDHSFAVPRGGSRTQSEVHAWIQDRVAAWIAAWAARRA